MIHSAVIVGSGNLAEALARAIADSPLELKQIWGRNAARAAEVAALASTRWTSDPGRLAEADIYLIAVSDTAVGEAAGRLPIPPRAVVAHTAGSVPIDVLPAKYPRRAVFYPLQTFTRGRAVDFSEIPLFIEASEPALLPELERFARTLSRRVIPADSALRAQVHLAAVFACNFANHMYAVGERIVCRSGLSFDVLKPLIAETAAKAASAGHPSAVQTGPAVRNDLATQERHLKALAGDPILETIYSTISQSIWETSRKI